MQSVAAEMNLSETAFLHRERDAYRLRWFTPVAEVDLCGHATLASAHVLWEDGHLPAGAEARFDTRSGRLTARRAGEWIEMDFPAAPARDVTAPDGLLDVLGAPPHRYVGRTHLDYLVELETEAAVRTLRPDFSRLRGLGTRELVGAQVSARGGIVRVRPAGERVILSGQAVSVLHGELRETAV
jgi:predicted PhzF superfamily epimerase YddE/YHI9